MREQLIAKYGANTVRGGGLKVYTTIVPRFQKLATQAMQSTLNLKTDPASALVSINPKNGAIRAMTAEIPGKKNNQFNLAAQGRRQAGSSFKTFVLTEAIREGINPDTTMYMSAPFHWQPDPSSEAWDVSTFDGSFYGPSSITQSTLRSDNSVYARLTLDLGPEKIVTLAHQMGIKTKLEPVASIGLGSNSVGVLEMASAYATIAAGGIYSEPMAIRKVVLPSGEVDRGAGWGRVKQKRVFSDGVAYQVARILKMNVQAGTGVGANPGFVAGGKTGTTDDFGDAWFAGITHDRVDGRLGRLSEREDPDDGGARDPGRRWHVPRHDLAPLHGRGVREQPACGLAAPERPGRLAAVPWPVSVLRSTAGAVAVDGHGERQQRKWQRERQRERAAHDDRDAAHDD